jgi:uncharacterized protein YwqG
MDAFFQDKITTITKNLLTEHQLDSYMDAVLRRITFETVVYTEGADSGFSKIGGVPQLPLSYVWPMNNNFPMQFLAQLRLSDFIDMAHAETYLPRAGLLYLFTDERQNIHTDFEEYNNNDKNEILTHFRAYNQDILRTEVGTSFSWYFCPNEHVELSQTQAPKKLELYPFFTGCEGAIEQSLVRKESFLQTNPTFYLPYDYVRSFSATRYTDYKKLFAIFEHIALIAGKVSELEFLGQENSEGYLFAWSDDGELGTPSLNPDLGGELRISGLSDKTKSGDFSDLRLETQFQTID